MQTIMRALIVCAGLTALPASAEMFVDLGVNASRVESLYGDSDVKVSRSGTGIHLGLGVRRSVAERSDLSFRLEVDDVDSDTMIAVRALDYRYNLSDRFAVNAFLGAARLNLATPAYGYYVGFGVQWKEILEHWDLGLDLRYGDKVARDNLLPSDPEASRRPDNFHDVTGASLYLSYRF
jgi:hypothetical protein